MNYFPRNPSQEVLNLCQRMMQMKEREGLTSTDLIVTFIKRRVLPLLQCTHIISLMTGL